MTNTDPWHADPQNVWELANWLHERGEFYNEHPGLAIKNVLYFFEKPWKWDDEWDEYQQEQHERTRA